MDPHAAAAAFPDRWLEWLQARFSGPAEAARAFNVDRRAAERWWQGGGCNARHLVMAVAIAPEAAKVLLPQAKVMGE